MPLDLTYLILIPAILFSLWAQARVKTTYARYSKAFAGLTGQEAARMVLEMNDDLWDTYQTCLERQG